jgi:hypothetical protein
MIFGRTAAGAALLPAVGFLVHGGPGPSLGLVFGDAALFVALLDVFGHPLLLAGVIRFVSTGHGNLHLQIHLPFEPANRAIVPVAPDAGVWTVGLFLVREPFCPSQRLLLRRKRR